MDCWPSVHWLNDMSESKFREKYKALCGQLVREMNPEGFWTGQLSTSALSTAVAIVALKTAGDPKDRDRIDSGFTWICRHMNGDGGYGDTPESISNASTTLLCYAAVKHCQAGTNGEPCLKSMEEWLAKKGISFGSDAIIDNILKFYGKDYTFSIPILSMLIHCHVVPSSSIRKIPVLPFELTLLPSSWYRLVNLGVVSYALPALIAVGIYLHSKRRNGTIGKGLIRERFIGPALKKLERLVPESGGFLEAIPLTGFVAMCLTASGHANLETVAKGLQFLRNQQREDGGWPIDTDLSTWVTTLSVKALGPQLNQILRDSQVDKLRNHLLQLQYRTIHPFNHAGPGGWGWTSFTGSVPDADDTPGAILALLEMYAGTREETTAIVNGCKWLMDLQNKDGGFPTFCKGWGKLPFDKSCADLTGHALLALLKSTEMLRLNLPPVLLSRMDQSISKALAFLARYQSEQGAWIPLWFGSQHTEDKTNPVYGTAKVGIYLSDCLGLQYTGSGIMNKITMLLVKAQDYLVKQQNHDGSWGSQIGIPGTLEETALAVCALGRDQKEAAGKGIEWLIKQDKTTAAPIGLYFALLWYDEKLYPLIYQTEALRRFSRV